MIPAAGYTQTHVCVQDNVDFGITSGNAPVTTANSMWVPISAYAIGVGYNVSQGMLCLWRVCVCACDA